MSSEYILKTHTQPCWYCTKACGGCSWSKNYTPIDGWVAEETICDRFIDYRGVNITHSYKILHCPELVDERIEYLKKNTHLRPYQIAIDLHCTISNAKRLLRKTKQILENEKSI